MKSRPSLGGRLFRTGMLTLAWGLMATSLSAGQGNSSKSKDGDYQVLKDPSNGFELEYPKKEWRALPSGGSTVGIIARNDGGATLIIERSPLTDALTPAEIGAMPDVEVGRLKEQQPQAKDFNSQVIETKGGQGALVRYSRVGLGGRSERVMQYSLPAGLLLFRLTGVVPDGLQPKHEPTLTHMIDSFKPAPEARSKP